MSYNTDLQENNAALEEILETVNNLPESGGNVDLGVTGATVGQTVKISAVDENGVPTAWESVDFPSGGGGGWERIGQATLPEDIPPYTRFSLEFDNPVPVEGLMEIFVVYYAVGSDQNNAEYDCPLEYITDLKLTNYTNANYLIRKASTSLYATTHFYWLNELFRSYTVSGTQSQVSNINEGIINTIFGFAMFPTKGYLGKGTTITVWARRR